MAARKKTTKKTAAKKTAEPVEAQEVAPVIDAVPSNGAASPINMTDEDVNAYLASVAKGEVNVEGMEADVAEKFRATTHQAQQVNQAVQQLSAQLEQGRAQSQQLAGELKGYATLLISSEAARREPKARSRKS